MGSFSLVHWLIVILVIMLLFGRGRISDLMGDMAKGINSFKKGLADDGTPPTGYAPPPPAPYAAPPQYAPPHLAPPAAPQPQYAPPAQAQYAPPAQAQYAPPAQAQYAPPAQAVPPGRDDVPRS